MHIHFTRFPLIAIASLSLLIASGKTLAAPNGNPTLPGGTTQFLLLNFLQLLEIIFKLFLVILPLISLTIRMVIKI